MKKVLKYAYDELEEKELSGRINEINQAHANQRYTQAWKLINDITDRKKTPTSVTTRRNGRNFGLITLENCLERNPSKSKTPKSRIYLRT